MSKATIRYKPLPDVQEITLGEPDRGTLHLVTGDDNCECGFTFGKDAERYARLFGATKEMSQELETLRLICLSMPEPELGEWNWPEILKRVTALQDRINTK